MKNIFNTLIILVLLSCIVYHTMNSSVESPSSSIIYEGAITKEIDDNLSKIEDITGALNARKGTLGINIFGGIEVGENVRIFNYKEGEESQLLLPLSTKGEIVLFVEFELEESYMLRGTGNHKGVVKFYVNYETTSYGKVILSEGRIHEKVIEKNDSWSKVNKVVAYIDDENKIYIVVGVLKGEGESSELAIEVIKDRATDQARDLELKGISKQDVFTLFLGTDEVLGFDLDSMNTAHLIFKDATQAILYAEDTSVLVDWWERIGQANRDKVIAGDAEIFVTGYAPVKTNQSYSLESVDDRVKEVQKKLYAVIKEDNLTNHSNFKLPSIYTKTRGKNLEDTKRCMMIEIK